MLYLFLVWPISFAPPLEYDRRKSGMVIYFFPPIWPLGVSIVCDKVYRFSASGRIGVRIDNFKYSMTLSNIARFPRRALILLLSYGVMGVAKKNCDLQIPSVIKKHLRLSMLETAQRTSAKKPTPY